MKSYKLMQLKPMHTYMILRHQTFEAIDGLTIKGKTQNIPELKQLLYTKSVTLGDTIPIK